MRDYYRAFTQRSHWAREDLLHTDELEHYEDKLVEAWGHAFESMRGTLIENASDADKRRAGLALYGELLRFDIRVRRDCDAPFIMRGSFHMLAEDMRADAGRPRVGWHADFAERLTALLRAEALP
jgi:hypothetical protein